MDIFSHVYVHMPCLPVVKRAFLPLSRFYQGGLF